MRHSVEVGSVLVVGAAMIVWLPTQWVTFGAGLLLLAYGTSVHERSIA